MSIYNEFKELDGCDRRVVSNGVVSNPVYAYEYARYFIRGRFPEGERVIASDPYYAYCYARYVLGSRFIEGEKVIASNYWYAYLYARDVIRGRFVEGEDVIASSVYKGDYEKRFTVKI